MRVPLRDISGFRGLLARAWERYAIPIAITEVHLGSTCDEQIRWFAGCWEAASAALSFKEEKNSKKLQKAVDKIF